MKEKLTGYLKDICLFLMGWLCGSVILSALRKNYGAVGLYLALFWGFGLFGYMGWAELSTRQKGKLTGKLYFTRLLQIVLFSMGSYVFFYKGFISPAVFNGKGLVFIPVAAILFLLPLILLYTELSYWWENLRKLLFANRVTDVKNYEFLLTFDAKNELLKYVGTIREMDRAKNRKWLVLMLSLPFATACAVTSFVVGSVSALFSAVLCYTIYRFGLVCTMACYGIVWLVDMKSAKKFFIKKK